MITKRFKFEFLFYISLLLIVCFEKPFGYASGSRRYSHTTHSHGSSSSHYHSTYSHPSYSSNVGHVSGGVHIPHLSPPFHPQPPPTHGNIWSSNNVGHESAGVYVPHPSPPFHPQPPPTYGSTWSSNNVGHESAGVHVPHPSPPFHPQPAPSHTWDNTWGSSNTHTPPPYTSYQTYTPHPGHGTNVWNASNHHVPSPSVARPVHYNPNPSVGLSPIGWKHDVYPHPSYQEHGIKSLNSSSIHYPSPSRNDLNQNRVYNHSQTYTYPPYPRPSTGAPYPYNTPSNVVVINNDHSRNKFSHKTHSTYKTVFPQSSHGTGIGQVHLAEKSLVSDKLISSPRTSCGMTLCPNVYNYPLAEISNVVSQADQMFRHGTINGALKTHGVGAQNFTSRHGVFSYGEQERQQSISTSSCRDQTSTIYPLEAFGSDDKNVYYVVNVPNLRQGLTSIQCSSFYQVCKKTNDVTTSQTKQCRQMYRVEQLLVLPSNRRTFQVDDLQLKNVHVPTGCACIASA